MARFPTLDEPEVRCLDDHSEDDRGAADRTTALRGAGPAREGCSREYLGKTTGLSRAQVTCLIAQYRTAGRVEDWRGTNGGRPFARVYTPTDIRLLAEADEIGGQLCGPAACEVLRREYEVFGDACYERLSRLSVSHLYNLAVEDLTRQADHGEPHQADRGGHRREAAAGPGRQARLRPRGHGAPGGTAIARRASTTST